MSLELKLSPQHGVNPALSTCFWCGADDGSILLMGRLPNDEPAPTKVCASYEPCPTCQSHMDLGITLMEADPTTNRPTGRWMVIKPEAVGPMASVPRTPTTR
jgi:hypothetical protein